MPRRTMQLRGADGSRFEAEVRRLEQELGVDPEFPQPVLEAAEHAAANPTMPDRDCTDIPFLTIDPEGAKDLDQALHIERSGDGYRLRYAIADVAAFVEPGGPIDAEAHRRGATLYGPDHRILLHPPVLSEDAASLLPDQVRPALVWTMVLDDTGEATKVDVTRARVRSRQQLSYVEAQRYLDDGTASEPLALLKEVGQLRLDRERERGGVSLPLPEQVVVVEDQRWSLTYRQRLPVENWNAQLSLLTGMEAAEIMLYGERGIIRTLPPPPESAFERLRRAAAALSVPWDPDVDYPDFVRSLDPNRPADAAMLSACAALLRGAGYVAFDGGVPEHVEHAALASEYAHVTAPLRRLVDRYAGEVAVALCADRDIPDWVRAAIRDLPKDMERADRGGHRYEAAVLDLVECGLLESRVGETFGGVVLDADPKAANAGTVMLRDLAIEAPVVSDAGPLPVGTEVLVRLAAVDVSQRTVRFELDAG